MTTQTLRGYVAAGVAISAALLAAGTAVRAQAVQAAETIPGVTNYTRVDATVACAGATAPEAMAEIKKLGFTSVINLRQASEPGAMIDEEKAAADRAGLRFIHLPFSGSQPDKAVVAQFLTTVADRSNQPLYIHCASATRVGVMWAIKRVMQDGWATDKALAEAEAIGLKNQALRQFVVDYLKEQGK
jgi:uncharacterized protein (TIGR01244 family)